MMTHEHEHKHDLQALSYARFVKAARPLSYSSEVSEAFRHRFPQLLRVGYGLSAAYVVADTAHHVTTVPVDKRSVAFADRAIFHALASFALPSLAVHTAVRVASRALPPVGAVAVGLATIPAIIAPIDHAVDYAMDRALPWRQ